MTIVPSGDQDPQQSRRSVSSVSWDPSIPMVKVCRSSQVSVRVNRIRGTSAPVAWGERLTADAGGPRSLVADGEATGPHAESVINAAAAMAGVKLVERRGPLGARNENPSAAALPSG
jgi:hypothetical protein